MPKQLDDYEKHKLLGETLRQFVLDLEGKSGAGVSMLAELNAKSYRKALRALRSTGYMTLGESQDRLKVIREVEFDDAQ